MLPPGSQTWGEGERCLVFVPGFLAVPRSYRSLLEPVAAAGVRVVAPLLTRPGPSALLGRVRPEQEAALLGELLAGLRASQRTLCVGGHSRGGLIAWLAAGSVDVDGLVLVDPVCGGGPPWAPASPLPPRAVAAPTVVVGLGRGGRCAPAERGHEVFAAAAPGCEHVVIPDAGHADVLDGRWARLGGMLCSHGSDPSAVRREVADVIAASVSGTSR